MCTIYTFSRDVFDVNKETILAQIKDDYKMNDDGNSLILLGEDESYSTFTQTMNIETVLALLVASPWTRMFLHLRRSTTNACNLSGCHGFRVGNTNWHIFHNGIIQEYSRETYKVDSQAIAGVFLATNSLDATLDYITTLGYANCMLVNVETGQWAVARGDESGGNLTCDEPANNFSTNPIKGLTDGFYWPGRQAKTFKTVFTPKKKISSYTPYWSSSYYKSSSFGDASLYSDLDDDDEECYTPEELAYFSESIKALAEDMEGFEAFCELHNFVCTWDIPWELRKHLSKTQLKFLDDYMEKAIADSKKRRKGGNSQWL